MNHAAWKARKAKVEQYFNQAAPPRGLWAKIKHYFKDPRRLFPGNRAVNDTEVDKWIKEAILEVQNTAKLRLDLGGAKIRRSFQVGSPANGSQWFKGEDERVRALRMTFTQVFLMDYFIACYRASYDLAEQAIMHDETEEFPYKEVTGFGTRMTSSGSLTVQDENEKEQKDVRGEVQIREFMIFISGGASLRVPFLVRRLLDGKNPISGPDDIITAGAETVQALRKTLSDYKRPQWQSGGGSPL